MTKVPFVFPVFLFISILFLTCKSTYDTNFKMSSLLKVLYQKYYLHDNPFTPGATVKFYDSLLVYNMSEHDRMQCMFKRGMALISQGREAEAVEQLEFVVSKIQDPYEVNKVLLMKKLAISYLRLGERLNCVTNHSHESCLLPIRGSGIHKEQYPSRKAIDILTKILQRIPSDMESRWVLNMAYMTIGEYPQSVPKEFLVLDLDMASETFAIRPFTDVAAFLGLNTSNLAGGVVVDDFNGDGYLDIITSDWSLKGKMHFFRNDGQGAYDDISVPSGISELTGGLNMMQTDYDNDGDLDVFVLRGAWMDKYGEQPNSLLRNNGDETFTDVTEESGLLTFRPTQTAVWRDFNKDGWLDVFIGNESTPNVSAYPSQFYINNGNGTFSEVAAQSATKVIDFIKGVTAGDYDNDGLEDIYISSLTGRQILLKNMGVQNKIPIFKNVTAEAGLADIKAKTFPTWFWDYNNDGWLDIFVSGYDFGKSVAHTSCLEALGLDSSICQMHLYKNNKDGTFKNVSKEAGLHKVVYAMGANFGDINNDGYPDMYLATGSPEFESLVPNKLFRNSAMGKFEDVTIGARVGNLQKGHGVAICDMDNDGDQDIFVEMGGAFPGDFFYNSLYLNPGQNENSWIQLHLEGDDTNRAAIGSRIKIAITENGVKREIFKDVNSGGSFGSSTLRQDIGLGQTKVIDELSITWQRSQHKQSFYNIPVNQTLKIKEGSKNYTKLELNKLRFAGDPSKSTMCKPPII